VIGTRVVQRAESWTPSGWNTVMRCQMSAISSMHISRSNTARLSRVPAKNVSERAAHAVRAEREGPESRTADASVADEISASSTSPM